MRNGRAIVVGGGISGILSAFLLNRAGHEVVLVEREEELGGLLRSWYAPDGTAFDHGIHLLAATGIPAVDELMFREVLQDTETWNEFTKLRVGNWFRGRLNTESPCIDLRALPPGRYEQALVAMLELVDDQGPFDSAGDESERRFGAAIRKEVFAPALEKIFDHPDNDLIPGAQWLFLSPRLIALNPASTRALKQSPFLDARLAFHSTSEGTSAGSSYYPRAGGIGRWITYLTRELREAGVEILTGEGVAELQGSGERLQSVVLSRSRQRLACEHLVWTLPPALLLRAAGDGPLNIAPPRLRAMQLHHMIFDRPFRCDVHFFYCYDPSLRTFRTTLYPSLLERSTTPPFHCTVEVLTDRPGEVTTDQVDAELRAMGVVAPEARRLFDHVHLLPAALPVLSHGFNSQSRAQVTRAQQLFTNLVLAGKARGTHFRMRPVLEETYHAINGYLAFGGGLCLPGAVVAGA